MSMLLVAAAVFGGGCRQNVVQVRAVAVKQKAVAVQQQVAYVAPVVQQQAVYPQAAYYSYTVGQNTNESERLDRLERLLLTQADTTRTIAAMLAAQQGVAPAPVSSLEDDARAIIRTHCLSCHSGDAPKADLDLGGALTTGEKLMIAESVADGSMPKGKPDALTDEERRTIVEWSRSDKPAIRALLRGK